MLEGKQIAERIDALEALLRGRGHADWAERLDVAVAGGATGTESLFRVVGALNELLRSRVPRDLGCEGEVKGLRGAIERHLRRI